MNIKNEFEIASLAKRIEFTKNEIIELYDKCGYDQKAEELLNELKRLSDEKRVRVVFVGPYTAGKSTIISALTNDETIKIDSDVATDSIKNYEYDSLILTDTPGLYADNAEHDRMARDTILNADILVYCISTDLFNQETRDDFKKLAFEMNYVGKMFLLVNKMAKEAGEYTSLCENYTESLNNSILPHTISEMRCNFVDARDYRKGRKEMDSELIAISHFEDFVIALNDFSSQKGILSKMDTPVMLLKASINDVIQEATEDESQRAYLAVLDELERDVNNLRAQLFLQVRHILRQGMMAINNYGHEYANKIGLEDTTNFDKESSEFIESECCDINDKLQKLCAEAVEDLNSTVDKVFYGETAQYFFNCIVPSMDKKAFSIKKETRINKNRLNRLEDIIKEISGKTIEFSTKDGMPSKTFWIKTSEAAGSQLQKAIKTVGNKIGINFRPWQTAKIAKNVGNLAKFAGPAIAVLGTFFDIKSVVDEKQREVELQKNRLECRRYFVNITEDLEREYNSELKELFGMYDKMMESIQENRFATNKRIDLVDDMSGKLLKIRSELIDIENTIF